MIESNAKRPLPKIQNKRVEPQLNRLNLKKCHIFAVNALENKLNKLAQTDPIKIKYQTVTNKLKESRQRRFVTQYKELKESRSQEKESIPRSSKKFTFNNLLLADVEYFYTRYFRKNPTNQKTLSFFVQLLQDNNSLLKKVSPLVLQLLLKLGCITIYRRGDTIYRQGSPIVNIAIILWGEARLKKQSSKFSFRCYPGYAIGEEILFEKITCPQTKSSVIEKGRFLTYENCKAAGMCGMLFIGEKQFNKMKEQMIIKGMKQALLRFQNLLLRSYLKKRQKRLEFG